MRWRALAGALFAGGVAILFSLPIADDFFFALMAKRTQASVYDWSLEKRIVSHSGGARTGSRVYVRFYPVVHLQFYQADQKTTCTAIGYKNVFGGKTGLTEDQLRSRLAEISTKDIAVYVRASDESYECRLRVPFPWLQLLIALFWAGVSIWCFLGVFERSEEHHGSI